MMWVLLAISLALGLGRIVWDFSAPRRRLARYTRDRAVLRAVVDGHRFGNDIAKAAGVRTGLLYRSLTRLESTGLVAGDVWEPQERGGPRRAYRATEVGSSSGLR